LNKYGITNHKQDLHRKPIKQYSYSAIWPITDKSTQHNYSYIQYTIYTITYTMVHTANTQLAIVHHLYYNIHYGTRSLQ